MIARLDFELTGYLPVSFGMDAAGEVCELDADRQRVDAEAELDRACGDLRRHLVELVGPAAAAELVKGAVGAMKAALERGRAYAAGVGENGPAGRGEGDRPATAILGGFEA